MIGFLSLADQMVKTLTMQETWGRSLEKGMAAHSSILAWRSPWTEKLAGYSPQEGDTTEGLAF